MKPLLHGSDLCIIKINDTYKTPQPKVLMYPGPASSKPWQEGCSIKGLKVYVGHTRQTLSFFRQMQPINLETNGCKEAQYYKNPKSIAGFVK